MRHAYSSTSPVLFWNLANLFSSLHDFSSQKKWHKFLFPQLVKFLRLNTRCLVRGVKGEKKTVFMMATGLLRPLLLFALILGLAMLLWGSKKHYRFRRYKRLSPNKHPLLVFQIVDYKTLSRIVPQPFFVKNHLSSPIKRSSLPRAISRIRKRPGCFLRWIR